MIDKKFSAGSALFLLLPLLVLLMSGCSSSSDESGPSGPAVPNAVIKGYVKSATTGDPVASAQVAADDGNSATSNASGYFELNLSSGNRTVTVTKATFLTTNKQFTVSAGGTIQANFNISQELTGGQDLRFVLSWNDVPQDLDIHLLTPAIDGTVYHIYWNQAGAQNTAPFAVLDVDEREGYGPETITVYDLQPGTYYLWVHRWTADANLAGSGARIDVYSGQNSPVSYDVPASGTGSYWNVLYINGSSGNIQAVNQIADPPAMDRSSYNIMLTWAEQPADLDAHLLTPTISGQTYHIYSGYLGSSSQAPYVTLNEDVTTGSGPELITIHRFFEGTYAYYVDNITGTPELPQSEALVSVWDGSGFFLLGGIAVPTTGSGRFWYAFNIDGETGEFTTIDVLTDISPAGEDLIYDDGTPYNYVHLLQQYTPGTMAMRMSPTGEGRFKILSIKFITNYSDENQRRFNAQLWNWAGDGPDASPVWETQVNTAFNNWVNLDLSGLEITGGGDFVVGFGQLNLTTGLGYDEADNGRAWSNGGLGWGQEVGTFFIRATIRYTYGAVEELGLDVNPNKPMREFSPLTNGDLPDKEWLMSR